MTWKMCYTRKQLNVHVFTNNIHQKQNCKTARTFLPYIRQAQNRSLISEEAQVLSSFGEQEAAASSLIRVVRSTAMRCQSGIGYLAISLTGKGIGYIFGIVGNR